MNPTSTKLACHRLPGSALRLTSAAALLFTASAACALGFGRPSAEAVLGEVLDLSIPVRLDAGEDLQDNCLTAEVYFGDNKQMQGTVQVRVEGAGVAGGNQRTVRVTSTRRVDEPFVTLYLAAGCTSTISRKFVLFADPPSTAPVVVAQAPAGGTPRAAGPSGDAVAGVVPAAPPQKAARSPRRSAATPSRQTASAAAPDAGAPSSGRAAAPSRSATPAAPAAAATVDPSLRVSPAPARTAVAEEGAGRPRLMLDPAEAELLITPELRMAAGLEQAPSADAPVPADLRARRAAAAAMWRALNASPEDIARDRLRLQELEARLAALRQTGTAGAPAAGAAAPGSAGPGVLVYGLAGLSAALAAALAAVLLRRRREPRDSQWWGDEARAAAAQASPVADAAVAPAPEPEPTPSSPPAAPAAAGTVPAARRTAELPQAPAPVTPSQSPRAVWPSSRTPAGAAPAATPTPNPPPAPAAQTPELSLPGGLFGTRAADAQRAVSVEELIDLEQQAEFFLVLGQDQAAIDLLESHVAGPAGGSPLPYLKLLELYRRRDDRQAYENLRERFNGRFNAYAPDWDADLQSGHSLSDYPGVIERLQALWTSPEKAMEVLQASLLRSDPQAATFDLPAYRELLFLYSVARDLAERQAGQPPVDLLLPFGDDVPPAPAVVEPLMATRPVKAQPSAQPPLVVDFTLDDIEPADAVPPNTPITPPPSAPSASAPPDTGPIEFEHIDIPKKSG